MKKQCLGRYNEEEMAKKKAESIAKEQEQQTAAEAISVGSRCQIQVPGQPTKLGTVMYVGKIGYTRKDTRTVFVTILLLLDSNTWPLFYKIILLSEMYYEWILPIIQSEMGHSRQS